MFMAKKLPFSIIALLFVALLLPNLHSIEARLGVCNGRLGNNLPSLQDTVTLYNSYGIGAMRLYDPDQATLQAVQGTNIKVLLTISNNDVVQSLGSDPAQASEWVKKYVVPYESSIKYIAVGNEIQPSDQVASLVTPALQNVQKAVNDARLGGKIKVSTAIRMSLMKDTSPPSSGTFTDMDYMGPIVDFLTSNESPLLVNIYPYFAYIADSGINIDFALLNPNAPVITDPVSQKQYRSLFDAQVDSVYAALAKAGASNTAIVVSESGWPSDGGDSATVDNAGTYYGNLIGHINQGTPMKPGPLKTYLFAMFDENLKTGDPTEQHFGLFTPDKKIKYNLFN